jgi:hypothetical protein
MNSNARTHTSLLLWPFEALWDVLAFLLGLTGRLIGAVLGLVFLVVGGILTTLVITAPVGIPIAAFGILLVIRSLF